MRRSCLSALGPAKKKQGHPARAAARSASPPAHLPPFCVSSALRAPCGCRLRCGVRRHPASRLPPSLSFSLASRWPTTPLRSIRLRPAPLSSAVDRSFWPAARATHAAFGSAFARRIGTVRQVFRRPSPWPSLCASSGSVRRQEERWSAGAPRRRIGGCRPVGAARSQREQSPQTKGRCW